MSKTLEEWVELYEKKTGDKFERDKRFELFYLPEKGFAEIAATGKMVWLNQLCGEVKVWRVFAEEIARKFGYSHAGAFCGLLRRILDCVILYRIELSITTSGKDTFARTRRLDKKGKRRKRINHSRNRRQ